MNYDIDKYLKEKDQLTKSLKPKQKEIVFQALWILAFTALGHFFDWGIIFIAPIVFAFVSYMYCTGTAYHALQKKHKLPDACGLTSDSMSFDYSTYLKHLGLSLIIFLFGAFLYSANTEFPVGQAIGKFFIILGLTFLIWIGVRLKKYQKLDVEVDTNE